MICISINQESRRLALVGHAQRRPAARPARNPPRPLRQGARPRRAARQQAQAGHHELPPRPRTAATGTAPRRNAWPSCASASSARPTTSRSSWTSPTTSAAFRRRSASSPTPTCSETPADILDIYDEAKTKNARRHQAGHAGAHAGGSLAAGADPRPRRRCRPWSSAWASRASCCRCSARRSAPRGSTPPWNAAWRRTPASRPSTT